jgi:hypothetical protein
LARRTRLGWLMVRWPSNRNKKYPVSKLQVQLGSSLVPESRYAADCAEGPVESYIVKRV